MTAWREWKPLASVERGVTTTEAEKNAIRAAAPGGHRRALMGGQEAPRDRR
jgi:hypothetical protein